MTGDVLEMISQDRKARETYHQRRKWYLDKKYQVRSISCVKEEKKVQLKLF